MLFGSTPNSAASVILVHRRGLSADLFFRPLINNLIFSPFYLKPVYLIFFRQ